MVTAPSPSLFHALTPKIGIIWTSPRFRSSGGLTCMFARRIWQPGCPPCSRRRYSSCQSTKLVGKPAKSSISFRRETSRRSSRTGGSFPTARSSSRCDTCGPRTEDIGELGARPPNGKHRVSITAQIDFPHQRYFPIFPLSRFTCHAPHAPPHRALRTRELLSEGAQLHLTRHLPQLVFAIPSIIV